MSLVLTALSHFHTHMYPYLLHTHEVSPQFEKVSWTTLDFIKWKCRALLSYVETFGHGLVYTSPLNSVNITIEIYSMPKLNFPLFRTPFIPCKLLEYLGLWPRIVRGTVDLHSRKVWYLEYCRASWQDAPVQVQKPILLCFLLQLKIFHQKFYKPDKHTPCKSWLAFSSLRPLQVSWIPMEKWQFLPHGLTASSREPQHSLPTRWKTCIYEK